VRVRPGAGRSGGLMDGTSRLRRGEEESTISWASPVSPSTPWCPACVVPYRRTSRPPSPPLRLRGGHRGRGGGERGRRPGLGRRPPMLVLGAGGVGLSVVMGAHLVGAAPIVVVDVARDKLDLAQSLGATDVVDASRSRPKSWWARSRPLPVAAPRSLLTPWAARSPWPRRSPPCGRRYGHRCRALVHLGRRRRAHQRARATAENLVGSLYGSATRAWTYPGSSPCTATAACR